MQSPRSLYIYFIYTQKFIQTHLRKIVTVHVLKQCLGGSDIKSRSVGNSLDELILFFLKKYLWHHIWNFVVLCILITL